MDFSTLLVATLAAFGTAGLAVPLVQKYAWRWQCIDRPDGERKKHDRPTPTLGGLAIVGGLLGGGIALLLGTGGAVWAELPPAGVWIGIALMAAIGIYDDVLDTNHKVKFVLQVLAAYLLLHAGYHVDLGAFIEADPYTEALFTIPVTMLWVVGIVNAVNLLDGLDGLAAGISLIGFWAMTALLVGAGGGGSVLVAMIAIGALGGFLIYNFRPASIFMGDSGSLVLGYLLAVISLDLPATGDPILSLLLPVVVLGVPVVDTGVTIIRRFLSGVSIFYPDHDHIHHRLRTVLSHRGAVLVLYAAAAWFGAAAFLIAAFPVPWAYGVLGLTIVATGVGLHYVGYLQTRAVLRAARYRFITTHRRYLRPHPVAPPASGRPDTGRPASPFAPADVEWADVESVDAAPASGSPGAPTSNGRNDNGRNDNGRNNQADAASMPDPDPDAQEGDGTLEKPVPYLVQHDPSGNVESN